MKKFELQNHPAVSYGNHIDDKDMVVLRVNEGDYEGTVFNFADVGGLENEGDDVRYSVEFQVFQYKGEFFEQTPPDDILHAFYETVTSPILYNIVVNAAQQ